MFKSIIQAGLKKALYGCAAALAVGIHNVTTSPPPSDEIGALVWNLAIIPAVTGIAGALARWAGFRPELAGK